MAEIRSSQLAVDRLSDIRLPPRTGGIPIKKKNHPTQIQHRRYMPSSSIAESQHLVLVLSANDEDRWALIRILRPEGWSVDSARTCAEAMRSLEMEVAAVVIVDRELANGNWRSLLNRLTRMAFPPKVIVTSRLADERLWAEVLNLGGHDVPAQPFYSDEVLRCISSASRHWQEQWREASSSAVPPSGRRDPSRHHPPRFH
jgi:DNA-binding response OmpR family regulator